VSKRHTRWLLAIVLMSACGGSSNTGVGDVAGTGGGTRTDAGPDAPASTAADAGDATSSGDDASGPSSDAGREDAPTDAKTDARGGGGGDASALEPVKMGVDANGESQFVSATGLTSEVLRQYLKGGDSIPTSVAAANLDTFYAAGKSVVYSIKADQSPDSQAVNIANLTALAKDITAKGFASKTWIALHHEPYPELTGAAFQTMYATYAPAVRGAGVRCGVIYQSYPLYHGEPNYASDYTSGILAQVDFIGIDVYPGSTPGGYGTDILSVISPFTKYAEQNGKRYQIDEVAVDSSLTGTAQQQAAWLGGLAKLDGNVEVVMYYEGAAGSYANLKIENDPDAVTTWKTLYQTLTTR